MANAGVRASLSAAFFRALSLFMATIYAPFAIAVLLGTSGPAISPSLLIASVLISMIVGTLFSATATRMSLAIAPAIGMTVFFWHGLVLFKHDVVALYQCGFLAGAVMLGLSAWPLIFGGQSIRHAYLENLPNEIKNGVAGGVGALLAEAATMDALRHDGNDRFRILMLILGAAAIVVSDLAYERLAARARATGAERLPYYANLWKLSYVGVPLMIFGIGAMAFGMPEAASTPAWRLLPFMLSGAGSLMVLPSSAMLGNMAIFVLIVVFIFLTDIPGTPFEFLSSVALPGVAPMRNDPVVISCGGNDFDLRETTFGARAISWSFVVDGVVAMLNALMFLPPSIYYAENHCLKDSNDEQHLLTPTLAYMYSAMLFVVLVAVLFIPIPVGSFSMWSKAAVSPVLLVIGIRIVALAMLTEEREVVDEGRLDFLSHLPTATTVVLTPIVDLQLSLPIGILVYCTTQLVVQRKAETRTWVLFWIAILIAIFGLVMKLP